MAERKVRLQRVSVPRKCRMHSIASTSRAAVCCVQCPGSRRARRRRPSSARSPRARRCRRPRPQRSCRCGARTTSLRRRRSLPRRTHSEPTPCLPRPPPQPPPAPGSRLTRPTLARRAPRLQPATHARTQPLLRPMAESSTRPTAARARPSASMQRSCCRRWVSRRPQRPGGMAKGSMWAHG